MTHKPRRYKVRVRFSTSDEEDQVASRCLSVYHFQPGLIWGSTHTKALPEQQSPNFGSPSSHSSSTNSPEYCGWNCAQLWRKITKYFYNHQYDDNSDNTPALLKSTPITAHCERLIIVVSSLAKNANSSAAAPGHFSWVSGYGGWEGGG